jgi:cytoskeletal protein CcmA (bactofilin family)
MALFTKTKDQSTTAAGVTKLATDREGPRAASPPATTPRVGAAQRPTPTAEPTARKLVVGREILVTGEITACDVLVVEGTVKADISACKQLLVADGGVFAGKASVESADILGRFDGDLSTSSLLWIHGSGQVDGKVRYKDMIVERGGRISGDVQAETTDPAKTKAAPKAALGQTSEGKTGPTAAA